MTAITGNTYPVREQLRRLGGRWNQGAKCWEVPEQKAEQARALVASAPGFNTYRHGINWARRCWECGRRFTQSECARDGGDWQESYCGC